MGRPKSKLPKYRYHISGQAHVEFNGVRFYLGPHDSPESHARYLKLVAEYQSSGYKTPERSSNHVDKPLTIAEFLVDFRENGVSRITPAPSHRKTFETLADKLDDEFGHLPVAEFGPRLLATVRESFVERGNCRNHANKLTRYIVRVFRWGVSRETVKPEQLIALESLIPLRRGEAKDNPKRQPVAIEVVEMTIPFVNQVIADMIRLQLFTGCRPSELFTLTPGEVDRTGGEWMIRKRGHKTEHHSKSRAIPVVGKARAVLSKYLLQSDNKLCFVNSRGNGWTKDTYRRHITRACKKNKLTYWTPYQIRHLVGQSVRDNMSAEHVQAILGHSKISMVETYSRAAESKAIEAAKSIQAG